MFLDPDEAQALVAALDLAEDDFDAPEASLFVIRHSLMSPFLEDPLNGVDYLERYCSYLVGLIRQELANSNADGDDTHHA